LRAGSADEARQTRQWLVRQGIEAHVLGWQPPLPLSGGLQAAARDARYRLLLEWCRRAGVLHLVTAHHADDQVETHVLRAARGSGPAGLAAMSALVEFPQARLLRPLLAVPRARLTATLTVRGQDWIDDPSNADPRFARARLRREDLPAETVLSAVAHCAVRRVAEESEISSALARCAVPHPLGAVMVDHGQWRGLPPPLAHAVLARAVMTVAGADYPPRRARAWRVMERMRGIEERPSRPPAGLTLGGCQILWRGGGWLVVREPAAMAPPGAARLDAAAGRWDGRFDVCSADGKTAAKLLQAPPAALTAGRRRDWASSWPSTPGLPAILATLPVSTDGTELALLAVDGGRPQAGTARQSPGNAVRACFRPRQPLASGPFFPCFAVPKGQIVNR
jgi:tRNA(Ile)-lysidine synthase